MHLMVVLEKNNTLFHTILEITIQRISRRLVDVEIIK